MQLVDVAPTCLELLGITNSALGTGVSLVARLEGDVPLPKRASIAYDEVPSTEIVQNEPQSYTVNLDEKVGVTEVP